MQSLRLGSARLEHQRAWRRLLSHAPQNSNLSLYTRTYTHRNTLLRIDSVSQPSIIPALVYRHSTLRIKSIFRTVTTASGGGGGGKNETDTPQKAAGYLSSVPKNAKKLSKKSDDGVGSLGIRYNKICGTENEVDVNQSNKAGVTTGIPGVGKVRNTQDVPKTTNELAESITRQSTDMKHIEVGSDNSHQARHTQLNTSHSSSNPQPVATASPHSPINTTSTHTAENTSNGQATATVTTAKAGTTIRAPRLKIAPLSNTMNKVQTSCELESTTAEVNLMRASGISQTTSMSLNEPTGGSVERKAQKSASAERPANPVNSSELNTKPIAETAPDNSKQIVKSSGKNSARNDHGKSIGTKLHNSHLINISETPRQADTATTPQANPNTAPLAKSIENLKARIDTDTMRTGDKYQDTTPSAAPTKASTSVSETVGVTTSAAIPKIGVSSSVEKNPAVESIVESPQKAAENARSLSKGVVHNIVTSSEPSGVHTPSRNTSPPIIATNADSASVANHANAFKSQSTDGTSHVGLSGADLNPGNNVGGGAHITNNKMKGPHDEEALIDKDGKISVLNAMRNLFAGDDSKEPERKLPTLWHIKQVGLALLPAFIVWGILHRRHLQMEHQKLHEEMHIEQDERLRTERILDERMEKWQESLAVKGTVVDGARSDGMDTEAARALQESIHELRERLDKLETLARGTGLVLASSESTVPPQYDEHPDRADENRLESHRHTNAVDRVEEVAQVTQLQGKGSVAGSWFSWFSGWFVDSSEESRPIALNEEAVATSGTGRPQKDSTKRIDKVVADNSRPGMESPPGLKVADAVENVGTETKAASAHRDSLEPSDASADSWAGWLMAQIGERSGASATVSVPENEFANTGDGLSSSAGSPVHSITQYLRGEVTAPTPRPPNRAVPPENTSCALDALSTSELTPAPRAELESHIEPNADCLVAMTTEESTRWFDWLAPNPDSAPDLSHASVAGTTEHSESDCRAPHGMNVVYKDPLPPDTVNHSYPSYPRPGPEPAGNEPAISQTDSPWYARLWHFAWVASKAILGSRAGEGQEIAGELLDKGELGAIADGDADLAVENVPRSRLLPEVTAEISVDHPTDTAVA